MKYQNVFFDLYGTLIDIKTEEYKPEIFFKIGNYLKYEGVFVDTDYFQQRFDENLKYQIATSKEKYPDVDIRKAFKETIISFDHNMCDYVLDMVVKLYRSLSIVNFGVFTDVHMVLSALKKDFCLGLITDAQMPFLYTELNILSLEDYFANITYSSILGFRKPDERIFRIALDSLNAKASQSVYIGDSIKRDVGSKKVGMTFILIKRGEYFSQEDFSEADFVVNSLHEAEKIIRASI